MKFNNQRGQFLLEGLLLMTLSLSLVLFAIKNLRDNNVLAKMVETPWDRTAGMIESGVWAPAAQAKSKVPYQFNRLYTPRIE